jgi:hypothetical protein
MLGDSPACAPAGLLELKNALMPVCFIVARP